MTANVNVTKVLFKRGNTAQNAAYTGINGEITVDTQAKTLRIHDGVTTGGNVIVAGGVVGSYSNTNAAAYIPTDPTITSIQANVAAANAAISAITGIDTSLLANAATQQTQINLINANVSAANALIPNLLAISSNILPSANITYSLGSSTRQWRDLWVSNNTIYIGNVPLTVSNGNLLVNGSLVTGSGGSGTDDVLRANVGAYQTFANSNAATQATSINTINANVGAYQTFANSNAATQATSINTINANVGAYQTFANANAATQSTAIATLQTQVYANANVNTYLSSSIIGSLSTSGNLTVGGNLVVNGNSTIINTTSYTIEDNILQIADGNPADTLDLGFVGHRTVASTLQHTGLVRDASAGNWRLFSNVTAQPGTTIDFTNAVYDDLIVGNISANIVKNGYTWVFGTDGKLTVPANGIITAPINQEFQLQAKDTNSVLRNEINLDPNNGTYMSVWSDGTTSFSSADWDTGSWNNESGLGAARFTDAQALQNFWTTGIGSFVNSVEVSINGGARTPNVFYENNNGETYGVYLGLDAVPPGGQGTTVPITSLVFYYQTQSKINMDVDGGEILLDGQALNINLQTTNGLNLQSGQTLDIKNIGQQPVRIFTDDTTHQWEFDSGGSLTLPREGRITGIGDGGGAGDRYGYMSWDGNSSGDGQGWNTMRLVPDLQGLEDVDTYIILDPAYVDGPGSIHIRAGGTRDNSLANLYLGGANSHVKIGAGVNPPVTVMANNRSWIFGNTGNLTFPGNLVIAGNTNVFGTNSALIQSTNLPIIAISSGANGAIATSWVEDVANIGTSNIASVYANPTVGSKIVRIAVGQNGGAGPKLWDFGNTGTTRFPNSTILAPASQSITMQSDQYSQLMWENANLTVAPNMAINSNFYVAQNNATLDIGYRDGSSTQIIKSWYWNADGTLTLPTAGRINFDYLSISSDANVSAFYAPGGNVKLDAGTGNAQIVANSLNDSKTWTFGTDGNLALPHSGVLLVSGGITAGPTIASPAPYLSGFSSISAVSMSASGNISSGNMSTGVITLTNGAVIKDTASESVSFGQSAGQTSQGSSAVAIGHNAGVTSQGTFTVAIGRNAGQTSQGGGAVAVGVSAGDVSQGTQAVAVGNGAGGGNQGNSAVAIGISAGQSTQGVDAVAIGNSAGSLTQGMSSIAIGKNAGRNFQGNNTIILNATGDILEQTTANTFTVAPVRNDVANVAQVMFYNTTSKEVTYGNVISVAGNINAGQFNFANGVNILSTVGANSYGNTQVATYLSNYNGDINFTSSTAIISNVDVITVGAHIRSPAYQFSNGTSILAGITGTYSNTNVAAYLTTATITTTGNITAGNVSAVNFVGTIQAQVGSSFAYATDAYGSLFNTGGVPLPADTNSNAIVAGYTIVGNSGAVTLTVTSATFIPGTPNIVQVATTPTASSLAYPVTVYSADYSPAIPVSTITVGNATVSGNVIAPNYLFANGVSILAGITGTYSNTNVAAYLTTATIATTGNITAGNLTTSGTFTVANITTTGTYGNITGANVISANTVSATNYLFANGVNILSTVTAGSTYSNANVATFLAAYGSNTISTTGNITAGNVSATRYNFANGANILANVVTKVTGSWTVTTGTNTYSIQLAENGTYQIWVDCNIPNGILAYNATATVTNGNVPVVGVQYAWVYSGGGTPIDFVSIPNQFTGTANTIVRSSVAPSATTNRFDFEINNTSGGNVTVRYGWIAIS